jgi:hypothetical protein
MHKRLSQFKEEVHNDVVAHNNSLEEELIQHRQRVYELGEQCYTMLFHSKQKLRDLNNIDVRFAKNETLIEEVKRDLIDSLTLRIENVQSQVLENERHMIKFLPL